MTASQLSALQLKSPIWGIRAKEKAAKRHTRRIGKTVVYFSILQRK